MDPVTTAAAISAGASVLGSLSSAFGQNQANKANKQMAREQMAFQERMSNTAVQRRMEDLRIAGINPILAGTYDASTPAGAMANYGNVGLAATTGFGQMAGGVQALIGAENQTAQTGAQVSLTQAQIRKLDQEVENLGVQYGLTEAQIDNVRQLTTNAVAQWDLIEAETKATDSRGALAHAQKQKTDYENITNAIVAKFQQEHPGLTVAQHYGLDGRTLTDAVGGILKSILR